MDNVVFRALVVVMILWWFVLLLLFYIVFLVCIALLILLTELAILSPYKYLLPFHLVALSAIDFGSCCFPMSQANPQPKTKLLITTQEKANC